MSARDELRDCFLSDSRDRFEAAADAYRAEVLREAAESIREFTFRDGYHSASPQFCADLIDPDCCSVHGHECPDDCTDRTGKDTQPGESTQAPAELTVYRAWHDADGIPLGLYTTEAAAREHCDTLLRREATGRTWDWAPDEDGDLVQFFVSKLSDRPEETTGYLVTPVTVAAEYDAEADE